MCGTTRREFLRAATFAAVGGLGGSAALLSPDRFAFDEVFSVRSLRL